MLYDLVTVIAVFHRLRGWRCGANILLFCFHWRFWQWYQLEYTFNRLKQVMPSNRNLTHAFSDAAGNLNNVSRAATREDAAGSIRNARRAASATGPDNTWSLSCRIIVVSSCLPVNPLYESMSSRNISEQIRPFSGRQKTAQRRNCHNERDSIKEALNSFSCWKKSVWSWFIYWICSTQKLITPAISHRRRQVLTLSVRNPEDRFHGSGKNNATGFGESW